MSVKVAVRVRPFNQREKDNNSVLCIDMQDKTTVITDHSTEDEKNKHKTFTFDYSFWSHDGFGATDEGYSYALDNRYADQQFVFNVLGKEILDNAWEGFNCCLFAYGQTGSGKSYSMVGYGANKGIVPISCNEIFSRIKDTTTEEKSYEVCVSMLEIYNEKIQDLLVPINDRPAQGLKVRESKTIGVFVDGLSKHPVTSYEEIQEKMDSGYDNRTIGSTLMNASSSRAHTIVTIEFKQITKVGGKATAKVSVINLVDLAGSERSSSTGATGDRLKEGCNINKSLLVLGNVINTLADKAMGKQKNALPPYRDSNLTRILQTALGGNSKTVMICALSPASINYEETLSTLRYADRAKKIQNKAVVNESESDKIVRLLKEENTELKKMLEDLNKKIMLSGGVIADEDRKNFIELQEQYEANAKATVEMEKSFAERVEDQKKKDKELGLSKVDITKPHLVVLNEDPQLSHKLKYSLKDLPVFVGRKHGDPPPEITLTGIGIKINHATFEEFGSEVLLMPNDEDAKDFIFINGQQMQSEDGEILSHKDRITFGTNTIFLFMKHSDGIDILDIDWESAQMELHKEVEKNLKKREENAEKKRVNELNEMKKQMEEKYLKEKAEMEEKMLKEIENLKKQKELKESQIESKENEMNSILKNKIKEIEVQKAKQKRELEMNIAGPVSHRKTVAAKSTDIVHKSSKLEQTLQNILRKLHKIKIIINEIRRNVSLEVLLLKDIGEFLGDPNINNNNILIRVENFEEGTIYYWTTETFQNRYDMMKELFDRYQDEDFEISNLSKEDDPLWDEPIPVLLGVSYYKLEPLGYLINNPCENASIININNPSYPKVGTMNIDVIPHDENGNEYEDVPETPEEIIGQSINFTVVIKEIKDLPLNFCKNVVVEYESFYDKSCNVTKIVGEDQKSTSYDLGESFEHFIEYLTKEDVEHLKNENITFKVYAIEETEKKGKLPPEEKKEVAPRMSLTQRKSRISNARVITKDELEEFNKKNAETEKEKKKDNCLIY